MSEAAKLLGVDRTRVQQLAREGKLVGRKLDGEWVIDEASVMARREVTVTGHPERTAAPATRPTGDLGGTHDEVEFLHREVHSLELELLRRRVVELEAALAQAERDKVKLQETLAALRPLVDLALGQSS